MITKCQVCAGERLLVTDASSHASKGWMVPHFLLPGTVSMFSLLGVPPLIKVVVCESCGFMHLFVHPEEIHRVRKSKKFKPL